jgi:hypothetical protein
MSDRPGTPKRSTERVPIHGALRGDIMVFEPLLIREVSTRGATVETAFPMHIDSLHDVRLTLGDTSVVLKGRVVHSRVSEINQDVVTFRTGLEFIEPSEPVLHVIEAFLARLKASRTTPSSDELRMHVERHSNLEVP